MTVLLTNGNSRQALSVTRSLGRKGMHVVAGDTSERNMSSVSRYCASGVAYPSPNNAPNRFQDRLVDIVRQGSFLVLIPTSDVTIRLVYPIRKELERYVKISIPEQDAYEHATDKSRLLKLAQQLDIPIPETIWIQNDTELNNIALKLKYPVVIKPRCSKVFWDGKWKSVLVDYARSAEELKEKYKAIHRIISYPLIQEKINGAGCGVSLLMYEREVKAAFAHKRIREKPPSGGVSVMRESISLDSCLLNYAEKILNALKWSGIAMVEFKIDSRDGLPKLMEINGRFWGSLQLAIDSGVNFPFLLYLLSIGENLKPCLKYKVGVKNRWFLGDIDHLLTILLMKRKNLNLSPDHPGRLSSLVQFFNFLDRNSNFETFKWSDPKPCLWEIKLYLQEMREKVKYILSSYNS